MKSTFNLHEDLLFNSPWNIVHGFHPLELVDYKPNNGFDIDVDGLIQAVQNSFKQAKNNNIHQSIVVGLIPFDATSQSKLFLLKDYCFNEPVLNLSKKKAQTIINQVISTEQLFLENDYKNAVAQAVKAIKEQQFEKVVLAQAQKIKFEQKIDIEFLLSNLLDDNPHAYTYSIPVGNQSVFLGSSPELLIRRCNRQIELFPLAGTAARSKDALQDQKNAEELLLSTKNLHEHSLVVEDIIEKLVPLLEEIELPTAPQLVATSKVWHLGSKITGLLKKDTQNHILNLLALLHPTPALCGSPRQEAANFIKQVEPFARNYFSGVVGWCDEEGNGEWAVSIRCGLVNDKQITVYAGAGIVADSDPEQEWIETLNKQKTIIQSI